MQISEEYRDIGERAISTGVQSAIGVTAGMSLAHVDVEARALIATVVRSAAARVLPCGVARQRVGAGGACIVT